MDALLMCGGRGTRLDAAVEKPLFEVGGRPMIDRVLDALRGSRIETIHAVVSPHTPATADHLDAAHPDLSVIETPGDGYVDDLGIALDRVESPALTVVSDLPLLAPDAVDRVLDAHEGGSLTVCVPAGLKTLLDVSADTTMERAGRTLAPTGLNVVATERTSAGGDGEGHGNGTTHVTYDARLAVNVNRVSDAEIAEVLL